MSGNDVVFIADVAPLLAIPRSQQQVFSYFLPRRLPPGSLVTVPVGRRQVRGVVLASHSVEQTKIEIRKASFTVRSVRRVLSEKPVFTATQLALLHWLSDYYWVSLGRAFALATPLEGGEVREYPPPLSRRAGEAKMLFVEGVERLEAYRAVLKDAEENVTLVIVPDAFSLRAVAERLEESVPSGRLLVVRGRPSQRRLRDFTRLLASRGGSVVVGMRSSLFLPFPRLDTVILDGVGDSGYGPWGRTPSWRVLTVARKLAELAAARLVVGDILLPVALQPQAQSGRLIRRPTVFSPAPAVAATGAFCEVVDLRRETRWSLRHPLSVRLRTELVKAVDSGQDALIFFNRKGIATALVCRSCGWVPRCPACQAALVMHQEATIRGPMRLLRCHHCGHAQMSPVQCSRCQSYRLLPFGAGTAQLERDVARLLPKAAVMRIDSDVVKTGSALRERVRRAIQGPGPRVWIGTQLLLKPVLLEPLSLVAVPNIEQFTFFPAFESRERLWRTLALLYSLARDKMLIQTHQPDQGVLHLFRDDDRAAFLADELQYRKARRYPPCGELLKFSIGHPRAAEARHQARQLASRFVSIRQSFAALDMQLLGPAPAFIPRLRGKFRWVIVVKLPLSADVLRPEDLQSARHELLQLVPRGWKIEVDPEELL